MRTLIVFSLLILNACGGNADTASSDGTNSHFPNYIEVNNLRFFGRSGVSDDFLNKVGQTYEAMLQDDGQIDAATRSTYLATTQDEHVFQLVGLVGPEMDPDSIDERPQTPWEHNATDYIWQYDEGGAPQIGEVVEHLLHTITAVGLKLAFPNTWDYNDSNSALHMAMQEAIDQNVYDISSYAPLQGDTEGYQKALATEYVYWLILAEWDHFGTADKNDEGTPGNSEFSLGTPTQIENTLPQGHQFYQNHVNTILSVPDKSLLLSLFP
jgi:hypothetical protein